MKKILLLLLALMLATSAWAQPPNPPATSVLVGQVPLAVSTSSARVALPSTAKSAGALTIYNKGTSDAYYALGDSSVVATTSSTQVPAGLAITVWNVNAAPYLAAITAASTTDLVIYQGNGPVQARANGGTGGGGTGTPGGLTYSTQINLGGGNFGGIGPGTTVQVLHGSASGAPSYGAVNLGTDVTGTLPNANLTDSSITIGSSSVSLGGTITTINGNLTFGGANAYGTPASIDLSNASNYPHATNSVFGVFEPDGTTITCSSGVCSSTGAVASVSSPGGTLTCSPTTGAVQCALNTSHANTISGVWTFGSGDLAASNIINGAATLTLPSSTDTLLGAATAATVANKTFTTPTINGGALSGTFSGGASFSGNLTFTGSNAIGTISSGNLAAGVGYLASNLSGIVPNANGGAGSLTGLLKATSGVVATAVVGTDYAAPGAVDLVPSNVTAATMTTRFASQNIEDVTGASVILTYPAVSGLLANGANVIYAIGGNVTIALTSGTDEICTPSCGSPGASFPLTSGYLGIVTTDQAGHLYIAVAVNSASGGGFPITIGSQSVAANSTNTSFAGMTLPSPTFSGTVAGSFTASGNITFSGSNALGTPASANLTNATNYPLSALTGAGTNVLTVLGIAANGTSGGLVRASGSTIDLTDAVNLPASTGISGLGTGVATLLGQTASGTGGLVGQASPTLSGTIGGNLTFSGNTTLSGTLTAASLSTVGTVAGSVCQTSAGLTLYEAGVNCYAGGGGATGIPQFPVAGNWYLTEYGGIISAGGALTTNTIYARPFYLQNEVHIEAIGGKMTTVGSSDIQFAIYAATTSGILRPTGSALCSTGNINNTSTASPVTSSCSQGNVEFTPGWYWYEANQDDSTGVLDIYSNNSSNMGYEVGTATSNNLISLTTLTASQTFGTWPSETSTSWTEALNNKWAAGMYEVQAVP